MSIDLPLSCSCGKIEGVIADVSPKTVNRVVCHCKYCVAFAETTGHGHSLDEHGGAQIFQAAPNRVRITNGIEHIANGMMSSKGPYRWHAGCCGTPFANTMKHTKVPFIGVVEACIDRETLGRPLEDVLGPVRARVNSQLPLDKRAELRATRWNTASMVVSYGGKIFGWWLTGKHKGFPFFDDEGEPIAAPTRLEWPE